MVYTYLRVIEDHYHYPQLRDKEVRFVVSLMRDRFADVVVIGRDLVRVLQQVAKIPEFATLWNDILMHPKSLSPTFGGITQLMRTRTSRRFLQSRITPEMEKKLVFLTSQVIRHKTCLIINNLFQNPFATKIFLLSLSFLDRLSCPYETKIHFGLIL